jgi:predicted short-subunit dehydrogenase-like oxidoreductase (DUF2520 family)
VGAGKVGISLALALQHNGAFFHLKAKSKTSSSRAIDSGVSAESVISEYDPDDCPRLFVIAVPNSEISRVDAEIAMAYGARLKSSVVCHTSGSISANVLTECRYCGAEICGAHPYQTFYRIGAEVLEGVSWGVESENNYSEPIQAMIESTGGKCFYLPFGDELRKRMYHISAVFGSNFMNTVISLAKDTARSAGIDPCDFLPNILKTTLENNIELLGENRSPLTGPISRSDTNGLREHIATLETETHLKRSYLYMSLAAVESAYEEKTIGEEFYREANELLLNEVMKCAKK